MITHPSNDPDPLHGLNPEELLAEVARIDREETSESSQMRWEPPSLQELADAFPELEIVRLIGCGGMSAVFEVRQPELDRSVALKVLPKSLATKPGFVERFRREGRVLARLDHPNIVSVHDFGERDGFGFLLMEFVDGVNLRQAMRASRFTPEQALQVIPKICDALQFAHGEGVLHRDIKPENILLSASGQVKIADFGIAKILGDEAGESAWLTGSGVQLGTAPYMAPEQIEKPATVDHRADIYSLGVVFYEMLTGELPLGRFGAPSEKSGSAVSSHLDDVILRALEKERERRQQSAGEFKTELEGTGNPQTAQRPLGQNWGPFVEYRSRRTVFGLPLLHVVCGPDPVTGKRREARGFFAFGDRARGVFAFGGIATGWVACGGLAIGGITCGGLGIGLISFGGLALGAVLAIGGMALGALAAGGAALGWQAAGGLAIGWHASGASTLSHGGMEDLPAATRWLKSALNYLTLMTLAWIPLEVIAFIVPWWARSRLNGSDGGALAWRILWLIPASVLICADLSWIGGLWMQGGVEMATRHLMPTFVSGIGVVLFGAALPLWLRLVPANSLYGLRIPATLQSSAGWYDINAFAGKHLGIWALLVMGAGLAGFYQLPRHRESYAWAVAALMLVATIAPVVTTYWRMRRGKKLDAASNRLISWIGQAMAAVVISLFIRGFILTAYRVPTTYEPGVPRNSQWIASRLDTGFAPGELVVFEHETGHPWLARVVKREINGLRLRRAGHPDDFFLSWDRIIGKILFSHFSPVERNSGTR
jgi:predicted Ser/Thr protein kinase